MGGLLVAGASNAAPRIEATPLPRKRATLYRVPIPTHPAPGRFRPKRLYAGVLTAMANPPSWSRPGRMGLGTWIEPPDRPAARPYLPHVLYAGDRVRTGPRGLARVDLPGGALVLLPADTILRLAGDGAHPGVRERVRLAVEPGLALIRSPWSRPLEIEVPFGLLHLEWGEVMVDAPVRVPDEARPEEVCRLFVTRGRATLHGRGRYRRRQVRLQAGRMLRWSHPDPIYWTPKPSQTKELEDLESFFLELKDGDIQEVDAAAPYPVTQPRKVTNLVSKRAVQGRPGSKPTPPTKKPRPTKRPPPTKKPPKDPFADPFAGEDPFSSNDPFGDF